MGTLLEIVDILKFNVIENGRIKVFMRNFYLVGVILPSHAIKLANMRGAVESSLNAL